jgi:hypothetical protein
VLPVAWSAAASRCSGHRAPALARHRRGSFLNTTLPLFTAVHFPLNTYSARLEERRVNLLVIDQYRSMVTRLFHKTYDQTRSKKQVVVRHGIGCFLEAHQLVLFDVVTTDSKSGAHAHR